MYNNSTSYGSSGGASYGNSSYGASSAQQAYLPQEQMYAHSSIDTIVMQSSAEKHTEHRAIPFYVPSSAQGAYLAGHTPHDYFIADMFLKPGSTAKFVGDAAEIKEFVEEAFLLTTGEELPKDIEISVLNDTAFRQVHVAHNGVWSEGLQGFSLNTNGKGTNQIFVRANNLDKLMLTIGHEIGHVLTPSLGNPHDEEAKAFAFSLAWMNAIREKNIAGIGSHILPEPAQNGLHDTAFAFVQHIIENGVKAWDAFLQLARGTLTITEQPVRVEV